MIYIVDIADIEYINGMPPEQLYSVRKLVNLTADQAKRISDFRFENRLASENEAIRLLIELGLKSKGVLTE